MKRKDFQELAAIRLKEASVLLEARCWDGAYYLGGYAIECALKACIAKQTERFDFPDKKRVVDSHTHDLQELVRVAQLTPQLAEHRRQPDFDANWTIVADWWEQSRYERASQEGAENLLRAVSERRNGVLRWLRRYW
jgi:HEPN domain-containing protein